MGDGAEKCNEVITFEPIPPTLSKFPQHFPNSPNISPNTFNQNSDNGRYPLTLGEVGFYEKDELFLEKTIIL